MINSGDTILNNLLNVGASQVRIKFSVPKNIGHDSRAGDRCSCTEVDYCFHPLISKKLNV